MSILHRKPAPAKLCLIGGTLAAIIVAGSLVGMSIAIARTSRQHEAKQALRNIGAIVSYHWEDDYSECTYPRWLVRLLGEDFFGRVDYVYVFDKLIPHEVARELAVLHDLERLNLNGCTIADDDLLYVANLQVLHV